MRKLFAEMQEISVLLILRHMRIRRESQPENTNSGEIKSFVTDFQSYRNLLMKKKLRSEPLLTRVLIQMD